MSLVETHPELLALWHPTKNLPLLPEQVSKGSHKRVTWVCNKAHEWEAMIYGVFGCPTCKYINAKVNLLERYPEVAKLWDADKNNIDIRYAGIKDKELYWWICDSGHSFQNKIHNQIERVNACKECHKNKIANSKHKLWETNGSHIKNDYPSAHWNHPLKDIESLDKYETTEWECYKCDGRWFANKAEMSSASIQGFHICGKTRKRLFEERPDLIKQWHPTKNFKVTKESVNIGSNSKYWWICKDGHEWETTASHRYKGAGCLHCSKSGYKPLEPAVLYFIYSEELNSFKVGITNLNKSRILRFNKLGWECLTQIEHNSGSTIKNIESKFFNWLRTENNIPQHLSRENLGYVMGATETFSAELISKEEVLNKIAELKTFYCK